MGRGSQRRWRQRRRRGDKCSGRLNSEVEPLRRAACRIMRVTGDSMEPTLPNGSTALVNLANGHRQGGKIFVIRVGEDVIVKRSVLDPDAGWLLVVSDNRHDHMGDPPVAAGRRDRWRSQVGCPIVAVERRDRRGMSSRRPNDGTVEQTSSGSQAPHCVRAGRGTSYGLLIAGLEPS